MKWKVTQVAYFTRKVIVDAEGALQAGTEADYGKVDEVVLDWEFLEGLTSVEVEKYHE